MCQFPVPFVVYSDGPSLPTGLARIARDLCARLWADRHLLGIELLQIGWNPRAMAQVPWPVMGLGRIDMDPGGDWGAREVAEAWQEYFGHDQGVLLSIWDPGRAYSLLPLQSEVRHLWGYFPIDGVNVRGAIGGPAAEAVTRYTRALAYTRWGSEVLATLRRNVPYLPHGLDLGEDSSWGYEFPIEEIEEARRRIGWREGDWVLGCVATNQPRKDLALFCATLAELRTRGHKVRGWLHTDTLVRAWAVPQLLEDYDLNRKVAVTLRLTDQELAACYACCGATLAVGLGEGFGYPIVESLACGVPPIHPDYAGGAELVPMNAWRIPYRVDRVEGIYGIRRPVVSAVDAANAVERAYRWRLAEEDVVQAYCRGTVEALGWDRIWPRWRSWIRQGLEGYRG